MVMADMKEQASESVVGTNLTTAVLKTMVSRADMKEQAGKGFSV